MHDRILKNGNYFIDRAILRAGNFSNRASIRLRRQAEGLMQYPWRHAIRVCDVTKIHPGPNGFVLVIVPVDGTPRRTNCKQSGKRQHQHKRQDHQPLSRVKFVHFLKTKHNALQSVSRRVDERALAPRLRLCRLMCGYAPPTEVRLFAGYAIGVAIGIVFLVSFGVLYLGARLIGLAGEGGVYIATRVMGIVLAALAVQYVVNGITDYYQLLRGH
jgi:hypothetical protein